MHIKGKNSWLKHLDFMLINLLSVIAGFIVAYEIRFGGGFGFVSYSSWRIAIGFACLCNLVSMLIANPFSGIIQRSYSEDVRSIIKITAYSFLFVVAFFFFTKTGGSYSRITILLAYLLSIAFSSAFTCLRKGHILAGKGSHPYERTRNLFVITEKENAEKVSRKITNGKLSKYKIVAYAFTDENGDDVYNGVPVININDISEYITKNHVDDVFVSGRYTSRLTGSFNDIVKNNVTVHFDLDSIIEVDTEAQFVSWIGSSKAVSLGPYTFTMGWMIYMMVKRVIDIIFAIIGCILMIPMIIVIKACYLLNGDKSSIFYSHTRVGLHGKTFKLYKFRSMVPNADEVLQELLKDEKYKKEWEENHKFENDPRITGIGKFIRKTSIDEFPQFINILKGDMSLIGPRPLVEGELEEHGGITLYNRVRPGITGWWGCNGRSNTDYKERLDLEYYYVKNCSLYLDILIIVKTIIAILRKEGAH